MMSELAESSLELVLSVEGEKELTSDQSTEYSRWQVDGDPAAREAQQDDSDQLTWSQPQSDDDKDASVDTVTPSREDEDEEEGLAAGGSDQDGLTYDQYLQLIDTLTDQVDNMDIRKHFHEKMSEKKLDENLDKLDEMQQQQAAELDKIEQLTISQSMLQQKLEEVEREWQLFMTQIHDVALEVAGRREGKPPPEEDSSSPQLSEQDLESHLNQLCSRNTRLDSRIDLLETYIQEEQQRMKDSDFVSRTKALADIPEEMMTSDPQHEMQSEDCVEGQAGGGSDHE